MKMLTTTDTARGERATGDHTAVSVADVLKQARTLIEKPEHWTQGALARDRLGNAVPCEDPIAVCWCASGAIMKSSVCDPSPQWEAIKRVIDYTNIPDFNDALGRTHAEVLAAFDRAIELATNSTGA